MKCSKNIREMRVSSRIGRRALALLLCVCVMLCALPVVNVHADAEVRFTDSGITFTINGDGNAEVVATREGYSGALVIPATVVDSGQTYPVAEIDQYAFQGCTALTSLSIPAGVTDFAIDNRDDPNGGFYFYGCTALTDIEVDPGNSTFCSIGGVLFQRDPYNPDGRYLLTYPTAKGGSQYTVPAHTDGIVSCAFYGCTSLTGITLPAGLTQIGGAAFYGCTNLADVTFQGSAPSYFRDAFAEGRLPVACHVPDGTEADYISALGDDYANGNISVNGQLPEGIPAKNSYLGGRGGSSVTAAASDPLKIEVRNDGDVGLFFWQRMNWTDADGPAWYGYQNQYYDNANFGTNLYFVKDSQQYNVRSYYYSHDVVPDGCSSQPLGNGRQTASGNTITTVWQADGGNLTLKQEITYQPGQAYYQKKWTVTNNGSEEYSDMRLIHGGDTYFGGDDDSRSYWNPQTRMVYVSNKDMTHFGLLGFYGSNETPADHYFSGDYWDGVDKANSGSLDDTADSDFLDAGYQLQWDNNTLAAGASWTVTSYEQITGPGMVQVLTPSEQTAAPGSTVTYEFTIQNFSEDSETYQIHAASANGWQTSVTEGGSVTLEPDGGTKVVHVNVQVPAGAADAASDTVTLTASSAGGSASASTRTLVNSSLPSILSVTSNSIIAAEASSMNVNVRTVNVPDGTPITVSLLDEDKNPLDPAVAVSGETTGNNTVVSLPLPGYLTDGVYHLAVSVDGISAVHNSTELSVSSNISTCTVQFNSDGGSPVASQTDAVVGGRILKPADPTKQGETFGGWYRDQTYSDPWDFSSDVAEGDMTLCAKWVSNSPGSSEHSVSSFDPLAPSVKNRVVPYGTSVSSLNLPVTLSAVVDHVPDILIPVSRWESNPAYEDGTPRTYTFTAVFPVGYTLASGVTAPSISVTVRGSSSDNHSNNTGSSSSPTPTSPQTASTQVDTASNTATVTTVPNGVTQNGNTTQIDVTVPSVTQGTGGSLDTGKAGKVTISLPESAMVQQLNAGQNVGLTLTVPSSVAHQTNGNTAVDIPVGSDVFAAAKASGTDVVINIKDADTQKLAYTWTFKGSDLAKSATPVTDVNIGMAIRLTTEVPQVNRLAPDNTGLVLMFDHSGVLPSAASLTFSAKEKGFKPGQKLYFYFYDTATGQLEPQAQEYTVDANGNVTVHINHCSNYVLLPNKARTITLDTRVYTMPVGNSYVTGVKLAGVSGAKLKAYSSTKGVADVTVLSDGNVKAKALKPGLTYVMIDVYDGKGQFLTHASVRLVVKNGTKPSGNSARQYGIF